MYQQNELQLVVGSFESLTRGAPLLKWIPWNSIFPHVDVQETEKGVWFHARPNPVTSSLGKTLQVLQTN